MDGLDTLVVVQRRFRTVLSAGGVVTNLLIVLVLLRSNKLRSQVRLTSLLLLACVDWARSGSALLKNDLSGTIIGFVKPNQVAFFSVLIGFIQLKMHAAVGLERLFAVVFPLRFDKLKWMHRRVTLMWFGLVCACSLGECWMVFRIVASSPRTNITANENVRKHWPPATRDACRPTVFNSSPLVMKYLSAHTAVCISVMVVAYLGIKFKLTKAIVLVLSTTIVLQLLPKLLVPLVDALQTGKNFGKLRCSVVMFIGTASLLNTALNMAIYSARMDAFKKGLFALFKWHNIE